ncbi:hypothetical protein RCL_jg9939.t1 [Rhizophagus clarus]|uniref:Uncharacterized protein n=1 Tax=Rhizophagus clarus TaxID=94130 RepID=A0A8H3QER5_9GLOM|nr:hypothetical protein RCL_jg9939.t1 [Rhizophagus clarus]
MQNKSYLLDCVTGSITSKQDEQDLFQSHETSSGNIVSISNVLLKQSQVKLACVLETVKKLHVRIEATTIGTPTSNFGKGLEKIKWVSYTVADAISKPQSPTNPKCYRSCLQDEALHDRSLRKIREDSSRSESCDFENQCLESVDVVETGTSGINYQIRVGAFRMLATSE